MKNDKMFNTKLSRSRKGMNDISILGVILAIFLLTAFIIPLINSEFAASYAEYSVNDTYDDIRDEAGTVTSLTPWTVITTIFKLAAWDMGNSLGLPAWLDMIYTLLGIIFAVIIARNIWVGGGG